MKCGKKKCDGWGEHHPDNCIVGDKYVTTTCAQFKPLKGNKAPVAISPAAMAGYGASLERPTWKVKIKGDVGKYEIWAIDWLEQRALVYRACGDEWVPLSKLSIAS